MAYTPVVLGAGDAFARSAGDTMASFEAAAAEESVAVTAAPASEVSVVVQATSGAASALPPPAVSWSQSSGAESRALTAWLLPTTPGKMPRYVKRAFRTKTFSLLSLQFLIVLAIKMFIDVAFLGRWLNGGDGKAARIAMVGLFWIGLLDLVAIFALNSCKLEYPANYIFLSVVTVLSGPFWALSGVLFSQGVFQYMTLGILCVACAVAASLSLVLSSRTRMTDSTFVAFCFVVSWLVGTACAVGAALYWELPWGWTALAVGVTLTLFCLVYKDVSVLLAECQPDDFMKVIVAMNSSLLVIVSVPILLLACCIFPKERSPQEGDEAGGLGDVARRPWDEDLAAVAERDAV